MRKVENLVDSGRAPRIVLGLAVPLLAVLMWVGGSEGASLPVPRTLADFDGAAGLVAQEGPRVAWFFNTHGPNRRNESCDQIRILNVVTGARTTVTQKGPIAEGGSCASGGTEDALVIAGGRLAWVARSHGNFEYVTVWFAPSGAPVGHYIFYQAFEHWFGGGWVGIAGSGSTLAYDWESFSDATCYDREECGLKRDATPVRLLDAQGKATNMPKSDVGNMAKSDVGHGRGVSASGHALATMRDARIVVQDVRTGKTLGGAQASSRPAEFALGPTFVAAVVRSSIEVYNWHTGRRVSRTTTQEPASSLSISGPRVAYAAGGAIWLLDIPSHSARQVAKPRLRPISVSINGSRIVWSENRLKYAGTWKETAVHGYVRLLVIP